MQPWIAADISDLTGKNAIVTGANSGIGYHTTMQLAAHGCNVVMACRDPAKGNKACEQIRREIPQAQLSVAVLDLSDLSSIKQFALTFSQTHQKLSLLINNAGILNIPYRTSKDGYELQFATNHLGHFALTGQLLTTLLNEAGSRVVTVSSIYHRRGDLDFTNLQAERSYNQRQAYANSKLANLLFSIELDRRIKAANKDLISVAAHPGYAATNIQYVGPEMEGSYFKKFIMILGNNLIAQSASQGALPILYASTVLGVKGGEFFGPDGFKEIKGYPQRIQGKAIAYDPKLAAKLWEVSETLTKVHFEF